MTKTKKQLLLEAFEKDPNAFAAEFHKLQAQYESAHAGKSRMSREEFERFKILHDGFTRLHREQFDLEHPVKPLPKKLRKLLGPKPVEKSIERFKRRLK